MKDLEKKLGKSIEKARQQAGLTQIVLAKKCGMTQASISEIEDGKRKISLHNLNTLAEALEIKLWVLVKDAEE